MNYNAIARRLSSERCVQKDEARKGKITGPDRRRKTLIDFLQKIFWYIFLVFFLLVSFLIPKVHIPSIFRAKT